MPTYFDNYDLTTPVYSSDEIDLNVALQFLQYEVFQNIFGHQLKIPSRWLDPPFSQHTTNEFCVRYVLGILRLRGPAQPNAAEDSGSKMNPSAAREIVIRPDFKQFAPGLANFFQG